MIQPPPQRLATLREEVASLTTRSAVAFRMEGDRVTKLRSGLRLALYGVQAPLAGGCLELMLAAVFEGQPGARDQILDGARDEHLRRCPVPLGRV